MITYNVLTDCQENPPVHLIPLFSALLKHDIEVFKTQGVHISIEEEIVAINKFLPQLELAVVALDGLNPIGVAGVPTYDPYLLGQLWVGPKYRGQGIATKLVSMLVEHTGSNYKVNVAIGNVEAKAFYKTLGMREITTLMMIHD